MAQSGGFSIDPELLPVLNYQGAPQKPAVHGPITSGVVRGALDVIGGTLGSAVAGAGQLTGSQGLENVGNTITSTLTNTAPSFNRPDLEVAPWQQGGANVAPWLEYQFAKQVPLIAAYIAGGKGLAKAGITAPAALERAAAVAPRSLGGGGLRAGADFATRRAALNAGKGFAQTALGAEAVGIPIAVGSMYQEAQNKPGGATYADAVKAAALSPFYAALDAVEPAQFKGLLDRGLAGNVFKRAATAGLVGSAAEVVQEGAQTALEQSFRTDLTPRQKFSNIVNAAVTGGAVGGLFGGAGAALGGNHDGSVRALKDADPGAMQTPDIKSVVDQFLGLPSPTQAGTASASTPREGDNFTTVSPLEQGPSFDAAPVAPRPYENTSTEDLASGLAAARKRIAADKSSPAIDRFVEAAHQELAIRNGSVSNGNVNTSTVEAVEPAVGTPGGTSGAPASTNTNIAELTKGLRLPARLKTALKEATNADEVQDIIHDHVIVQGKAGKNIDALAQRAGVLDNDGKPTALADQISERKTGQADGTTALAETPISQTTPEPAAPANLEGGDPSEPAKMTNRQLLHALGANNPKEVEADLPAVAAAALTGSEPQFNLKKRVDDMVQREARRRGLLKPVMSETGKPVPGMYDYSDKAREMLSRNYNEPIPTEDTANAAATRGFKGAQVSQFDRGAQAFVKGIKMQKMADSAWQAGHRWAENLASAPITHEQTQSTLADLGNTENRATTSDEVRTQEFNRQIDDLGVTTTAHPAEVATLKRMVANGASDEQLNEAIQMVRNGEPLFEESEREAPTPFKGEIITRGPINAKTLAARQAAARQGEAVQLLGRDKQTAADQELIQRHRRLQTIRSIGERLNEERAASQARDQEVEELSSDPKAFTQRNRYKRGLNGVISARAGVVQAHVDEITKNWKSNQKVHVVEQLDELPADIQRSIARDDMDEAYGFTRGDEVYLLTQNLPNLETATAALYHEALGHLGLHSLFREQMDSALERMYRGNAALRKEVDAWRASHKGYYRNDDIALAVEEVLAIRSEGGRLEAGLLSKIAAIVKAFARRMGINLKFSDNEIEAVLAMAHDQVINGDIESSTQKGLRYMMMLWHGSPHDHNQFSTSKIGSGEGAQVFGWGLYFASIKDVAENYRDILSNRSRISAEELQQWAKDHRPTDLMSDPLFDSVSRQAVYIATGHSYLMHDLRNELLDDIRQLQKGRGNIVDRIFTPKSAQIRELDAAVKLLNDMEMYALAARPAGKLYNVAVKAIHDQFLDWFKPLSEQSAYVRDALKRAAFPEVIPYTVAANENGTFSVQFQGHDQGMLRPYPTRERAQQIVDKFNNEFQSDQHLLSGADIYHMMRKRLGSDRAASLALLDAGIRGNTYEDQFSRSKGSGTHNYVVFDDSDIEIVNKYMRPAAIDQRAQATIANVVSAGERFLGSREARSDSVLRKFVGAMNLTHLTRQYSKDMPEIAALQSAHANRKATASVLAHLFQSPNAAWEQLQRKQPKFAQIITEIMEATAWGGDPTRAWSEQTHLHDQPDAAALEQRVNEVNRKYNTLKQAGHHNVYDSLRKVNEVEQLAGMSVGVHQLASLDPELSQINGLDPMIAFRNDSSLHNPDAALAFWHKELAGQIQSVRAHIATIKGTTDTTQVKARMSPIESYLAQVDESLTTLKQAPYFHLGRTGDQTVSGSLRKLESTRQADPAAAEHVANQLAAAGFDGVRISRDLTNPSIFMRVDTQDQRVALERVMQRLQREGWLDQDVPIKGGQRSQGSLLTERTKAQFNQFITALEANPLFEPTEDMDDAQKEKLKSFKQHVISSAHETWLDLLPDNAQSRVLAHRKSVQGYSTDMMRNFAFRYQVGVHSLANLTSQPYINQAFEGMRSRVNDARHVDDPQHSSVDKLSTIYTELALREAQNAMHQKGQMDRALDQIRAATYNYFLAFSPSYGLTQLTQMPVLLWPELAKKHGFVKSAQIMARVTPLAFKVMRTAFQQGAKVSGVRAADAVITNEVLTNAGLDDATAKFLMNMIGRGIIDIGGAARELATFSGDQRVNPHFDKYMRYGASVGLYTETFTRLVAALSARELHKGTDQVEDYAEQVVRESMLEYSTWNVPRVLGKMGAFGKFTPLMTQFLSYNVQVVWKLYSEIHTAFANKAATATEKAEARKFLLAHATVMMTLAGTLGLPFATVLAGAIEKLVDAFDDDDTPYDATAAYRNFLADMMGPDLAQMVARGLPRVGGNGFDLSQRIGEQSIIPFSEFMADRRKWKDAIEQQSIRSAGAPMSMIMNVLNGIDKVSDGNVLGGMADMVPIYLKGPTKAYQMYTDGKYKDGKGNVLPMTPGASAILSQVLGLNPAEKAEYSEAYGDAAARKGLLVRDASNLRKQLSDALIDGDIDTARDVLAKAEQFDRSNPAFAVLPSIESSIKQRARQRMLAATNQTPLGVSMKDLEGQRLTRYANIDYTMQ